MSTSRTCTTPKDGWALYHHFLGNLLLVIRMQGWDHEEESEEKRDKRERVISDAWSQLLGHLYMIKRRMMTNGHQEDAAKMGQIVDMVVELDLTDPEVIEAIHNKEKELNTSMNDFEANLAKLRVEHSQ